MKFRIVLVIYNRRIHYTVAVNKGWKSLWLWRLPMIYHVEREKAEQDMAICLKEEVVID